MGGVYIIIGDQTLPKGGVSPRKVPPPPPIPHIILDQQAVWIGQCSHSVQSSHIGSSWDVGMACNVFKLLELLWPHPPDVQACTSMYEL